MECDRQVAHSSRSCEGKVGKKKHNVILNTLKCASEIYNNVTFDCVCRIL